MNAQQGKFLHRHADHWRCEDGRQRCILPCIVQDSEKGKHHAYFACLKIPCRIICIGWNARFSQGIHQDDCPFLCTAQQDDNIAPTQSFSALDSISRIDQLFDATCDIA